MEFRKLNAGDVECRIGNVSDKGQGVSLLLYKTARVDAEVLDSTVGTESWQCEFYECKGTLFCRVGIDINGEWVWKSDAGAPSNVDREKGEASDAFKRACFKWGLGRELYTAPFIWIPAEKCSKLVFDEKKKKWACFDRFEVQEMEVEDGRISLLTIDGQKGTVFRFGTKKDPLDRLRRLVKPYAARRGVTPQQAVQEVQKWAHVASMAELPAEAVPEVERMMLGVIDG